jgi:hypothetical protein
VNDIEERFNRIQEVAPDVRDLSAIKRIARAGDIGEGISLGEMDNLRAVQRYSGKISLRVPRTLHRDLVREAKEEGISLNQFINFKLAK